MRTSLLLPPRGVLLFVPLALGSACGTEPSPGHGGSRDAVEPADAATGDGRVDPPDDDGFDGSESDAGEDSGLQSTGCEGVPEGGKESRVRFAAELAPFGGECVPEMQERTCSGGAFTPWTGSFTAERCEVASPADCDGTLHGESESRVRYAESEVPYGSECQGETQLRTCSEGMFGAWSGTYQHETCTVREFKSCGETAHGARESRVRYARATVPFNQSCESQVQVRLCTDGVFGEWSGSFAEPSCEVEKARDCEGGVHGEAQSRVRYLAPVSPLDGECDAQTQTRTCFNGYWTVWDGSWEYEHCAVRAAESCEGFRAGTVDTRVRYASSEVPFGQQCSSQAQSRTCRNGKWTDWSGHYQQTACSVGPPSSCGDIPHGTEEERLRYETADVRNGACRPEKQRRVCQSGTWTRWTGSYTIESCSTCVDLDYDYHGEGCVEGPDCDDTNRARFFGNRELEGNLTDEDCDDHIGMHLELVRSEAAWEPNNVRVDGEVIVHVRGSELEFYHKTDLRRPAAAIDLGGSMDWLGFANGIVVAHLSGWNVSNQMVVVDATDLQRVSIASRFAGNTYAKQYHLTRDGALLIAGTRKDWTPTSASVWDLSNPRAPSELSNFYGCFPNDDESGFLIAGPCKRSNDITLYDAREPRAGIFEIATLQGAYDYRGGLLALHDGAVYVGQLQRATVSERGFGPLESLPFDSDHVAIEGWARTEQGIFYYGRPYSGGGPGEGSCFIDPASNAAPVCGLGFDLARHPETYVPMVGGGSTLLLLPPSQMVGFDVSSPSAVTKLVERVAPAAYTRGLVHGERTILLTGAGLYIAPLDGSGGVLVPTSKLYSAMAAHGSTLYLGDDEGHVYTLDLATPAEPRVLLSLPSAESVVKLVVPPGSGDQLFIISSRGLYLADLTQATAPAPYTFGSFSVGDLLQNGDELVVQGRSEYFQRAQKAEDGQWVLYGEAMTPSRQYIETQAVALGDEVWYGTDNGLLRRSFAGTGSTLFSSRSTNAVGRLGDHIVAHGELLALMVDGQFVNTEVAPLPTQTFFATAGDLMLLGNNAVYRVYRLAY